MGKYVRKNIVEANQWFKNGDHPLDYTETQIGFVGDEEIEYTPERRKQLGFEGDVVRYYRHPNVDGSKECEYCGNIFHVHGWIDLLGGGHIVCPGDWIITNKYGVHYPCKADVFEEEYMEVK